MPSEKSGNSDFVVSVRNVDKRFKTGWFGGYIHALRDVSLDVRKGSIFGLLGPNGAGKTTLIKILLGIIRHSKGDARLLNYKAGDVRGRRRVGYLPEQLKLPKHQTARTALEFYGRLSGMSHGDIRSRRDGVLETVGLMGRDRESVRRFSKGMQQRLGLAQALLHDPEVLFLDEPTDGLDPVGRSQVRDIMRQLRAEGRTVFVNSHLLQEVELVCDQVAILNKGQLRYVGVLEDLMPSEDTTIEIGLVGEPEKIKAAINMIGECDFDPSTPMGPLVRVETAEQAAADRVIDTIRQHSVGITRLTRRRKTLEDKFLELISADGAVEAELI